MPRFGPTAQQTPLDNTERQRFVVNANYELFVVALTVLQLLNSFLWLFVQDPQGRFIVAGIFLSVGLFLFADAIVRLTRVARRKRTGVKFNGWLLIIGSLPIPFFIFFRLAWNRLMIRTLQRADLEEIGELVIEKRAQSTLLVAVFAAIVVLELASVLIIGAESQSPQANIHDASDAVWWSIVTMATVGYGDKYPVTNPGRVIGIFVMIVGVGLFSIMTSFLAQWFLRTRQPGTPASEAPSAVTPNYQAVMARLDALTASVERLETAHRTDTAELRATLAEIEAAFTRDGW